MARGLFYAAIIVAALTVSLQVSAQPNAVDLGLSVKWASCNLGANQPEEYGNYYAWGEVKPKDIYLWRTYKLCKGDYDSLTKYNTKSEYGQVDYRLYLEDSDDAAYVALGGRWRIPTAEQWGELIEKCSWEWISEQGKTGVEVTGPNGNKIFLPAAGNWGEKLSCERYIGHYWTASLLSSAPFQAFFVIFDIYKTRMSSQYRTCGFSIRPVLE